MIKLEHMRVQEQSLGWCRRLIRGAVLFIACDGVADNIRVQADLVHATVERADFAEGRCSAARARDDGEAGVRLLRTVGTVGGGVGSEADGVAAGGAIARSF